MSLLVAAALHRIRRRTDCWHHSWHMCVCVPVKYHDLWRSPYRGQMMDIKEHRRWFLSTLKSSCGGDTGNSHSHKSCFPSNLFFLSCLCLFCCFALCIVFLSLSDVFLLLALLCLGVKFLCNILVPPLPHVWVAGCQMSLVSVEHLSSSAQISYFVFSSMYWRSLCYSLFYYWIL